jgi:hypothetical protein
LRAYRRRRLAAGTIFRPHSERRLIPPGSRIFGPPLFSAGPARPARHRAGKRWSMGIAYKPVNSRPVAASFHAWDSGKLFFCTSKIIFLSQNIIIGQSDKLFSLSQPAAEFRLPKRGLAAEWQRN